MTRSDYTPPSSPASRLRDGLALSLLLLTAACQRRGQEIVLPLAEVVPIQAHQVATRAIDPATGEGLELLEAGWRIAEDAEPPLLESIEGWAVLEFWAPSAEAGRLALEGLEDPELPQLTIRLNGRALTPAATGRSSLAVETTPREGSNRLELRFGAHTALRLRRIALPVASAASEGGWIRLVEAGSPPRLLLETPGGSRLERVVRVPDEAVFAGRFAVVGSAPARVRVTLRDESGSVHLLWQGEEEKASLRVPLDRWEGELAAVRLEVADHTVRWLEASVRGVGVPASDPKPLAAPRLPARPDVVVVLLDAARADAFGCYGSRWETPSVDRLAAEGTRFVRSWAPSSWTAQSVPSLLTGFAPDALGPGYLGDRLPESVPTLAQRFAEAGYRTALWSHHPLYLRQPSLLRGFDTVERNPDRTLAPGDDLFGADPRPLFAWIHLLPPHGPYDPPAPFFGRYTDPDHEPLDLDLKFLSGFPAERDPATLTPEALAFARNRYGEMVSFADSLVGRVIAALERTDRYRNAVVVLLADHGEAFAEHGRFLHTSTLHRELLEVPFVIRWPENAPSFRSEVDTAVSLVDLAPTLAALVGLDPPPGWRGQGRSLLPLAAGSTQEGRVLYASTRGVARRNVPPKPSVALEQDGWKVLFDLYSKGTRLYHTAEDPGETEDRSAERPLLAEQLRQEALLRRAELRQLLAEGTATEVETVDEEADAELRALGYL